MSLEEVLAWRAAGRRELGTIREVFYGIEPDHDVLTCSVLFDFGQAFGWLAFKDERELRDFGRSLRELFSVEALTELVGKSAWALRCRGTNSDPIEGIEYEGKRFTLTGFRRRHDPRAPSARERYRADVEREIISRERVIARLKADLEEACEDFIEWETAP
jgi:hypothetical protein